MDTRLRKRPSQGRSRSTVTSILEAADRILRADGYAAASTNRVARVAGFSVGSLYQYFRDKQSIVGALIDRALAAEASELADLLERDARPRPADLVRDAFTLLLARRAASAHLYRALDAHASELRVGSVLDHIVGSQAPLLSDTLQRVAAHAMPRSPRSVDGRTFVIARLLAAVSYALAVDHPQGLDPLTLREELGQSVERFLDDAAPPQRAVDRVTSWARQAGSTVSSPEQRARRRREARGILLAAELDAERLEPCTFLLAGLAEVAAAAERPPRDVSQGELLSEVARFAAALGA